ncbi:MAG: NADH-quinone oxidoreductase subunit NuoH [Chloroflexi bacterium]|nr:NADH-quinone oxidoreductase subunit NuoH [Chloroflexota bacterium]
MEPSGAPNWAERWILNFFGTVGDKLHSGLDPLPDWLAFILVALIAAAVIVNLPAMLTPFFIYIERKWLGRLQSRIGPNRVGPMGLLQPFADAVKLMTKEGITPTNADKLIFNVAPVLAAIPVFIVFSVIPYSYRASFADLNIGILFVVAVTAVIEVAVFAAAWASNNKYALVGAARAVAMLISYEIPLALAILPVVIMAGSLRMSDIVDAQRFVPFAIMQPLAFLLLFTAVSAELNRTPFDVLEAESELTTGYHVEYSGMKWGLFMLGEYAGAFAWCAVITTLFLSGWKGPLLPGYVWFALKVLTLWLIFIWVRATFPRLRIDQITGFAWKFMMPMGIIITAATAIEVLAAQSLDLTQTVTLHAGTALEKQITTFPEWFALINIALSVVLIVGAVKLFRFQGKTRQVVPQQAASPMTERPATVGGR